MLELTFLGWQGWLVATRSTRVLVDPLLVDGVGRGPPETQQRFLFYPPRALDLRPETCPRIDALLISHEHEDHFNVASLARIDRSVPVILSARSSLAARTLLDEMGFTVRLGYPGERFEVGDLSLTLWTPKQDALAGDEWDTLAYLFSTGRESFFSNVDVPVTDEMQQALAALDGAVLCYEGMTLGAREAFAAHAEKLSEMHRAPKEVPVAGDDAVQRLADRQRVRPVSGQTFVLSDGLLSEMRPRCDFLGLAPEEHWPAPVAFWRGPNTPFEPRTTARELDDDELAEVEEGLGAIAQYLYDSRLMRRLYSQSLATLAGREPTFVWLLCTSDAETVVAYAYRPEACAFEQLEELEDPIERYTGTVVTWAADLLGLLRGEFEPRCISLAITEHWHESLKGTSFFVEVLWQYFHPLRHPERTLARYRAVLAEHAATQPVFLRKLTPDA